MALDWVEIRLPNFQQMGKFLLWASGRVTFSLWLFGLHSLKMACKIGANVLEMTERASHQLLAVYTQLPYSGTLPESVTIETRALSVTEPENIITDLVQALTSKHCMIVGNTGTGKSTIAQWLAYQIGGTVTVYDADAAPDEWAGLQVVGRKGNFSAIAQRMADDLEELQRRVELRGESGDKALAGMESVLIAEEFPLLVSEVDIAVEWLIKHGNRGRKPKRFVIALSQDDSVKSLGIEGQGNARNNFVFIRLGKFAVKHAMHLKDDIAVEWLKGGRYRCLVEDVPCQLPDLSQFKAVTQQLLPKTVFQPVVTAQTTAQKELQPVEQKKADLPKEVIRAVQVSLSLGIAESRIIKEILGYQGGQYQEGKELLETIKSFN